MTLNIQPEFDFEVHEKENNRESQDHLDENRKKWKHQCKVIFDHMVKGNSIGNEHPYVWDESKSKLVRIGHLPRRIADIKEYLSFEKSDIEIGDKWVNGYKEYFIKK